MSKTNGPNRKKLYQEMVNDEGEFCKICNVTAKERQLVILDCNNPSLRIIEAIAIKIMRIKTN